MNMNMDIIIIVCLFTSRPTYYLYGCPLYILKHKYVFAPFPGSVLGPFGQRQVEGSPIAPPALS